MRTIGIIGKLIPEEHIFENFENCKKFVKEKHVNITG